MAPKRKPPGGGPDHDPESPKPRPTTPAPPADVASRRRDSPAIPRPDDAPGAPPIERSEDFGGRKDIEKADEPVEEHDRRHHGRDGESGQSAPPARRRQAI
jgi:hypothetical protein